MMMSILITPNAGSTHHTDFFIKDPDTRKPMFQSLKRITRSLPCCIILVQALLQELHPLISPCLPFLRSTLQRGTRIPVVTGRHAPA